MSVPKIDSTPFYYSWTAQLGAATFPVQSARDDHFILEDGSEIFDFISTSFQANFGHSFEPIRSRIAEQLQTMPIASPKATFELKSRTSQKLLDALQLGPGKIFYTVSGAEAVENALKIARQITGRPMVAARQKSYHGASLGALSVTGDWRNQPHLTFAEHTLRIPEHDADPTLEMTEQIITEAGPDRIAAVILETISGTNGMAIPPRDWLQGMEALCRRHGILLIIDEVLVGFGRCGEMFAFHEYGLKPDLVCLSKAISGGYIPFGALWTHPKIAEHYQHETLACGLTNYGHPLGLAAMDAVLETLNDPTFQEEKAERERLFQRLVHRFQSHPDVEETRCRGMMAAIYLSRPTCSWQTAFQNGMHLYSNHKMVILAPPYNCDPQRLEAATNQLLQIL